MTLQEIDTFLSTEASARKPLNWASMSQEEKDAFESNFPNRSFSDEQRAVLRKFFILVPSIDAINGDPADESDTGWNGQLPPDRKLSPVQTTSGDWVLPLSLWMDNQTWGGAMNALHGLRVVELTEADFPQEEVV